MVLLYKNKIGFFLLEATSKAQESSADPTTITSKCQPLHKISREKANSHSSVR